MRSTYSRVLLSTVSAVTLLAGVSAAQAGTVTGRVSDGSGVVSLDGALVRIPSLGKETATTRDGSFRLNNVPAGTYEITVSYIGADPVTQTVEVSETGVAVVDVKVGENLTLMENILVIGQFGSMNTSLSKQRASDRVSNFLSSDAVGQFPDQNVTEAVRRISGLSMETDQGEGRYVVVRGIDGNLNGTSINGVRVPSPDGGGRKVALDVIPSELISEVEISKSLTADMDADSIGGNIDIKSMSAFDHDGFYATVKVQGSYNELEEEVSPKIGATFSNVFADGKVGVAASVSWFDRDFGSDNMEIDGGWTDEDGDDNVINGLVPPELEQRDYIVNRERLGLALNLDFRPDDTNEFYIRTLYSDFSDQEYRSRIETKFEDGAFDLANTDIANGIAYFDGIEADRDLKDRLETQEILSIVAGGSSVFNNLTLDYSIGYSEAGEKEPDRVDTDFKGEGFNAGIDVTDLTRVSRLFLTADDAAGFHDASVYELDAIEYSDNTTTDKEWAFKIDASYDTDFGGNPAIIKAGAKYRMRDKSRDNTFIVYDDFGADYTLAVFATTVDYRFDDLGPVADPDAVRNFFEQGVAGFGIDDEETLLGSTALDYEASEDILAGYLMSRVDIEKLRLVAGVRVEHTKFKATGNTVIIGDEEFISTVNYDDNYTDVHPSLNLRYEFQDNLIARFGFYTSVVRPNIEDQLPSGEVEAEEDDGEIEREGALGNPSLKPYEAINFDFGVEWYPSNTAIVSAGVFYKEIDNFIFDQTLEDVTYNGIDFKELVIPVNGDKAELLGFELNYQQSLTMLPSPWDGLLIGLNYTYVDSEGTIEEEIGTFRDIPLPKTSENVFNATVGYEKGPVSLRVAASYRDDYLDEVNASDGDRYVLGRWLWDVSGSYQVTDMVKVFAEWSNASDSSWTASYRNVTDGTDRMMQYDEFGYTINFGVKATF